MRTALYMYVFTVESVFTKKSSLAYSSSSLLVIPYRINLIFEFAEEIDQFRYIKILTWLRGLGE